jgi:hypothetical protein
MKTYTLDKDIDIPVYGYCVKCIHLDTDKFIKGIHSCTAFPDIPLSIWSGENKHETPYPGDNGIIFQSKSS